MKILSKILLSLALAAGMLILLAQIFTFGLQNNRNFKISHIRSNPINVELLIQGTCQSELSIDPSILQEHLHLNAYNLSTNHSNYAENYLFLREYLKHQKKPKAVLLYASPDSFAENGTNIFNSFRFSSLLLDEDVKSTVEDFDINYVEASRIPFLQYSYYSNFLFYPSLSGYVDLITRRRTPMYANGFVQPSFSWMQKECFKESGPSDGIFIWSPLMEKYFLKIINLLQKHEIPIIVYEGPIFYHSRKKHKNRVAILNKIDSLCAARQVPFLKFDTLRMNYDRKNFFTTHNTTIEGNAIFNPILCKILKDTLHSIIAKQYN